MQRPHFFSLGREELELWIESAGEPAYRARQILDWVYARRIRSFDAMTDLPKRLRQKLSESMDMYAASVAAVQTASDETQKSLLRWPDGNTTECVMIPSQTRRTACISTQVGCPVGCVFCASGLDGLRRNLTSGEIVEQVAHLNTRLPAEERITNVVFMGLGEPLGNYKATVQAVRRLNAEWGANVGARRITVSTVGLPGQMRRLADEKLQITLAVSLHAPSQDLRDRLIPWASRYSLADLVDACRYYFDHTGREVTFEYILLAGVNDSRRQAEELARITKRVRANVNLIRYHPIQGLEFDRPHAQATEDFADALRRRGVNVHVRASRGMDIDAACGQLRLREMKGEQLAVAGPV